MAMQSLRQGAASGIMKFFLMGLLVLAVGGLVLMDVGGFFRGGLGSTDIAKVGPEKISLIKFDRSVQRTLQRIGMSPEEAYKLGYIDELLGDTIRSQLMVQSAQSYGIEIGQERIKDNVKKIIKPRLQEGQNPQEVLNTILLQNGMREAEFVSTLKQQVPSQLLRATVESGFAKLPHGLSEDMFLYQNEMRSIDYIFFSDESYKAEIQTSDEQLQKLYQVIKEQYARPERRDLTLAILDAENLENTIVISPEELLEEYENNLDSYYIAQQRKIDQAIVKSELNAQDILGRVKKGTSLKNAVIAVEGEEDAYLGLQTYEEAGLLEDISKEVFTGEPRVLENAIQTPLGWHVIEIKEDVEAYTKSFDEVKDELAKELKQMRVSDELYQLAGTIDDMLASGTDFFEMVEELKLQKVSFNNIDNFGLNDNGKSAFDEYFADREIILSDSFDLLEGESSAVIELNDGRFATIFVQKITPKEYPSFEEVKEEIQEKWISQQKSVENKIKVMSFVNLLNQDPEKNLKNLADGEGKSIKTLENFTRADTDKAPLTPEAMAQIFTVSIGSYVLIDTPEGAAIAKVLRYKFPDNIEEEKISSLEKNLQKGIQSEAIIRYLQHQQNNTQAVINKKLLDQYYGPNRQQYINNNQGF